MREDQILPENPIRPLFRNLSQIDIKGCHKLRSLFPITVAQGLEQLKDVNIQQCSQLEEVFRDKDEANSRDHNEEIKLPQLENLHLKELPRFTNFFPMGYHLVSELEKLSIKNCGVKVAFQLEGPAIVTRQRQLSLSSLNELWLMHLKELEVLYKGPKHILRLRNLTQLYISSCPKLRYIFTLTVAQDLLQLTQLRIRDCEDLEQIIVQDDEENEIQEEFFPKLLQIDVKECNKLRSLFPITIAKAKGLQQLKDILVERCSQLEEVFGDKDEAHSMDDKKIVLPQVEKLYLKELPNLTNFCPLDYHVMILELKFLEIGGCQQQLWDRIVLACLRYGSKNLENLIIRNCGVKMLFQLEELPNLKELKLESLKEIEGLTHISLQNLTKLYVNGCHKLTHIFSCTLAQNMSQLKELYIRDCEELKQIIFEGDEEDQNLLQKLSYIYVRGCHKLKHLFPLTIVQGMKELQDIRITDNSALEQVFGDKGGNYKEIELRQLSYLVLVALPRLANFCPVGYRFKFPSLEQLGVWECPMIASKFSFAQDKSVHVEAKVELPPEPTMDIFCVGHHDLEETLLTYIP